MLNIQTGLEGVLRSIQEGAIAQTSEKTPEVSSQIKEITLGFFGKIELKVYTVITQRGVGSTTMLLGGVKGTKTRGLIGRNGLPIGRNKTAVTSTGIRRM